MAARAAGRGTASEGPVRTAALDAVPEDDDDLITEHAATIVEEPVLLDRAALLTLLEHLDESLLGLRFDGSIAFASPSVKSLLGWDAQGLVGTSLLDYLRPGSIGPMADVVSQLSGQRGTDASDTTEMRALDGQWVPVRYHLTLGPDLGGLGDLVVTLQGAEAWDERRAALVERALNEDRLVRLASIFVNYGFGQFDQALDAAVNELAGLPWVTRVSVWRSMGERAVRQACWTAPQAGPHRPLSHRLPLQRLRRLAAGEELVLRPELLPEWALPANLSVSGVTSLLCVPMLVDSRFIGFVMVETTYPGPVFEASHFATLRSACAVLAQAFERHDLERELNERASTDRLTALANRWTFLGQLDEALVAVDEGRSAGVAVALMDLDRFKIVNDSLGHEAGDRVLIEMAHRLMTAIARQPALAAPARLGGDEFLVMAPQCATPEEAVALLEQLVEVLIPPFDLGGQAVTLTASVGVVHARDALADGGELLRRADLAMYQAKGQGGGRVELEDGDVRERVTGRISDEAELRTAIEDGQLRVHFQGEWDLEHRQLLGAEALVRWQQPERGMVPPALFIPLAEECGLIGRLGMTVLREACRSLAGWSQRGLPEDFVLRVNVSALQLADATLATEIADVLASFRLDPERVCLELTESSLLVDPVGAVVALDKLRELGVGVAVDDFGTGFSSLLYLKELPLTSVKIDKAFVDGLPDESRDRAIVASVVRLAEEIGISVTAEGVERAPQASALLDLGCRRAQGFLLSRPEPADRFEARLGPA
jgi:diguanylate cyclase (GGDEF)-like protein/PAS domain S-box-containing protein